MLVLLNNSSDQSLYFVLVQPAKRSSCLSPCELSPVTCTSFLTLRRARIHPRDSRNFLDIVSTETELWILLDPRFSVNHRQLSSLVDPRNLLNTHKPYQRRILGSVVETR